jgi:hypothetical protein
MKSILLLFLMSSVCLAGDPKKDFYGTPLSWGNSKNFLVSYSKVDVAREDCERLGFKIQEDYKPGSFLVCELSPTTSFRKLLELTACDSVVRVSPNPTFKAIEK